MILDLTMSEEQAMIADTIRRLFADIYSFEHRRHLLMEGPVADEDLWRQLSELGAFGLFLSDEDGGFGGTLLDAGIVMQELGRSLVMEPVGALAMAPARLLARIGDVDRLAAQNEGAERFVAIDLTNFLVENGKCSADCHSVEGAPMATGFLALDGGGGLWHLRANDPGVSVDPFRMVDCRLAGDVRFDAVSAERIADDAADAFAIVRQELAIAEQWFQLGSMLAATEQTVAYVKERRQFGRRLADFQLVQARIAEMAVACEEARAAVLLAAIGFDGAKANGEHDRQRSVAGGRIQLIRLGNIVASNAVQLHGGMGVSEELPIAAHYRQSVAFAARHGTLEAMRRNMADAVLATGKFAVSAVLGEAS